MGIEARPIRLSKTGKFIAAAIVIALLILFLRGLGPVLTPFIAAAISAYLFNPLITWCANRTKTARGWWILLLYIVIGTLIWLVVHFVGPMLTTQYRELRRELPLQFAEFRATLGRSPTVTIAGFEVSSQLVERQIDEAQRQLGAGAGTQLAEQVPHLFASVFEFLVLSVSYLMLTFYLLLESHRIVDRIYSLVPAPYRDEIRSLGTQIDGILAGYIRGVLILIPIMSTLTTIALSIMGVQYALVLGILTGILESIPLIGPWSAAGIAIAVAALQNPAPMGLPHLVVAGIIAVTYFVLRISEDNFIIPYVVGPAVHLHPMLVIVAILSGGAIAGPFGLFVAIPVTSIIQLLLRYLYTKMIDAPPPPPQGPALRGVAHTSHDNPLGEPQRTPAPASGTYQSADS